MIYMVPALLLILIMTTRGRYISFGRTQMALRIVVALPLLFSGFVLHFLHIRLLTEIIPPAFPMRSQLVIFTGICEIAGAIGLFVPRVSRAAALWLSLLMIASFPANVFIANKVIAGMHMPSVPVRGAMQIVYIVLILLAGYGLPAKDTAIQT